MLRHALQLFLLLGERFEPSGEEDFIVELVDRAARSCLTKHIRAATLASDDVSSWLSTAKRCLNYAHKVEEDAPASQLSEGESLKQLQLCVDFCTRIALKHSDLRGPRDALAQLASAEQLTQVEIVRILRSLEERFASGSGSSQADAVDVDTMAVGEPDAEAIASVTEFKYLWLARELEAASPYDPRAIVAELASFLQGGVWVAGCVPPMVGRAIQAALKALDLDAPYEVGRGNRHCFDSLSSVLETSMRSPDSAIAGLVCSKLQQAFVGEVSQWLDEGKQREGETRKRSRLSNELCERLAKAVEIVRERLNEISLQASALYHLAFVKAFIHIACRVLKRPSGEEARHAELAVALDGILVSPRASGSSSAARVGAEPESTTACLQEYTLKELRRYMSMDELMQDFRSGDLGRM